MNNNKFRIPLTVSTFYDELNAKQKLCDFILKSAKLSMGEKVAEFEKGFAATQTRQYATFVNSGSSANLALLQSLMNLKRLNIGDKVGYSAVTWSTNVMPIIQLGLVPIPIDINTETLNVATESVINAVSQHGLKAVFLTNLLGFSDEIHTLEATLKDLKVLLLEDNCESLGSEVHGKLLGSYGLAATYSTFVGHHISTVEGGLVVTDDPELDDMLRIVRAHGWTRGVDSKIAKQLREENNIDDFYDLYSFYFPAYNLRPTELNAVIGLHSLEFIPEIIDKREKNFVRYEQEANRHDLRFPLKLDHMTRVSNFAYPLIFKSKEQCRLAVKIFGESSIECRPIVGGNMARQPFMKKFPKTELPCADLVHTNGLYLPNNPEMTPEDLDYTCQTMRRIFEEF